MITALRTEKQRLVPIALAQAVGLTCGVLGIRVVSHLVDPAALGAYGVFLTFTTIGTWIVYSGLTKLVGRYWAGTEHASFLAAVRRAWVRKLGWLVLGAAAAAVAIARLAAPSPLVVFAAVLVSAAALSVAALAQAALQTARLNWHDLTASGVGSVTRTFVPPLLYAAIGAVGLYAGFAAHAVCFAAVAAFCIRRTMRRGAAATPVALEPVYQGALFTTLAFIGWVLAGENRWLTAFFFGDVVAGYFTLGSNIALIVPTMLGAIILQFLQPRLYAVGDAATGASRAQLAREVDTAAAIFAVTALVGVVAVRLVAPWLIGPLIHARYAASIEWLLPAGCFGVGTTTAGLYHTLLLAGRRERGCGPADIATAALFTVGAITCAAIGAPAFKVWLTLTPILPWVVTRPIARSHLFKPASAPAPSPAR